MRVGGGEAEAGGAGQGAGPFQQVPAVVRIVVRVVKGMLRIAVRGSNGERRIRFGGSAVVHGFLCQDLKRSLADEAGSFCAPSCGRLRIPLILISHSGRSRSPIPVILIMLFTMPEEGTADRMTWRWTATTDG
jgi:hypothetical protein